MDAEHHPEAPAVIAIPFAPVTPAALARLTAEEQIAFGVAADYIAADQKPPMDVIVTLLLAVCRLISERDVPPAGSPRTLRDVLRGHYLADIICDHDAGADNPVCACSLVHLGWHGSVGLAVEAWIDHVLAETETAACMTSTTTQEAGTP